MAYFTENAAQNRPSILNALSARIAGFFEMIFEAQNRSVTVQRLQALTDRELADIGIAREDIVRHVYRDIYYV